MRPSAVCFILYGTHSPLSSIPVPDADRTYHPGPPPERRRAGADPNSARRTSVVASDATLPRTLRPVGLAQRCRPAQGHGLPLALAQTPGPGAPEAAAAPACFSQSPAQPPRRRSAALRGPPPRRVGGVASPERSAGVPRQPGGWVVPIPASALSLPGPAQLCRREPQIPGARAPRPSGSRSVIWFPRLAVPAPRRLHRLDPGSASPPPAAADQQHPFPHFALGAGAASGQPYLEFGHSAPEPGLAGSVRSSDLSALS